MNIDDLQNAINILYNPQGNSIEVKQQAQLYCNNFAQTNAANLHDFFMFFAQTDNQATRFWLLQAIVDIINNYYNQVFQSPLQRQALHQLFFSLLRDKPQLVFQQKHYLTKYALIFVLLVREDFPEIWPEAFQELLSLIKNTQDIKLQKLYMMKVLQVFEEELIERQEQKTAFLLDRQGKVKDGMRVSAITDIIFVLTQLLQSYEVFDEEVVNEGLEVMAQLIDWNALELFAQSLDLFKMFLKSNKFRTNALLCLHAFVHKGMDYPQKVELIVNMNFMDILEQFKPEFRERPPEDSEFTEQQEQEEEFFSVLSEVVDKLGQWCLEIFQNEDKLLTTKVHQEQYEIIFARTLKLSIDLLDTDKPKIGRNCLEFNSFWVQAIKKFNEQPSQALAGFNQQMLTQLLQVLVKRMKYPDWCTFEEGSTLSEHEEDYIAYREELAAIFTNLALIKPYHEQFIQAIAQLFESIIPGKTPFNQAEVPLFLAYHLHQAIPTQMRESTDNEYYQLMLYIIKIDFFQYDHKIVSLMLLEDLVRYSSYFIREANFLNNIVAIFFSKKAIMSNEPQLASRACYLLLRLCEKMQNNLINQAEGIVEATSQVISKVEQGQHQDHLITYDDLQYLYNIIGIFVSNKKIDYEYRRKIVMQIMDSLISRLVMCSQSEKDKICWILKFLNVFTKGFQQEISVFMKESFAKVLQSVLNILPQNMNHTAICDQILQYLQRNVLLLGNDVKPFMVLIAQPFIQNVEFERLDLFLTIINYMLTVLRSSGIDVVESIFLNLLQKMNSVKIPESDLSDIDKNNIRIFQSFFKLMQTAVEINSSFLLTQSNLQYCENFISYLRGHFEMNVDKNTKRLIASIFKELLLDFSGLSLNPQVLQQFGKKVAQQQIDESGSVDKTIATRYPILYQSFIEQLLWLSLKTVLGTNPINLEEVQIAKIFIDVQAIYVIAGFSDQMLIGLKTLVNEETANYIIQQCQSVALKQINNRQLQDNYMKLISQLRQQQQQIQ